MFLICDESGTLRILSKSHKESACKAHEFLISK